MMMEAVVMTIIVAVGMAGVYEAVSMSIQAREIAEAGLMAERIAQMKMSEVELSPLPSMGNTEGTVICLGREFVWKSLVEESREPGLLGARVTVEYKVRERTRRQRIAMLVRSDAREGE